MQTLKYDIQYKIRNNTTVLFREETRVPQFSFKSQKEQLEEASLISNCLKSEFCVKKCFFIYIHIRKFATTRYYKEISTMVYLNSKVMMKFKTAESMNFSFFVVVYLC